MSLSKITNTPHLWTAKNDPTGTGPGAVRTSSNPTGAAQLGFWSRLWSPLFASNKQDSSCYDRLNAKYPQMDGVSRSIVKILCDNNQTAISTDGRSTFQVSDQGVEAIGEALQENTALQSFDFNLVECMGSDPDCIGTLSNALAPALTINRSLKELVLDFSAGTSLATQTLLHNLPCYNLNSLYLEALLNSEDAEDFSNTIQSNPYFPLKSLGWMYSEQYSPAFPKEAVVGIGSTRCITTLDLSKSYFISPDFPDLFQTAIGNSRIANFLLPTADLTQLTPAQEQAILSGITNNPCFLNYTQPSYPPGQVFPPNLAVAIQNLLQGRTPCAPDPRCLLPVSCSTPTPPNPAPPSSGAGNDAATIAIAVSVTAVGSLVLGWFANHAYQKCKRPSTPLSQQLM